MWRQPNRPQTAATHPGASPGSTRNGGVGGYRNGPSNNLTVLIGRGEPTTSEPAGATPTGPVTGGWALRNDAEPTNVTVDADSFTIR